MPQLSFEGPLKTLRILAFLEGSSLLVLLFITMPLKYLFAMPQANQVFGLLHGILFILYVIFVLWAHFQWKWTYQKTFLALIASIIPFGTFWADRKLFNSESPS